MFEEFEVAAGFCFFCLALKSETYAPRRGAVRSVLLSGGCYRRARPRYSGAPENEGVCGGGEGWAPRTTSVSGPAGASLPSVRRGPS